ncbi:hypothetical protein EVAR_22388_1 [Eumeta japonica]|uniref:Uncharacterized protein n=1 Tax=Eumeta variegata TaxID=151549 RepID=A0A4C1VJH3_EUMVA|nr:hypothetical protein EVAR_22388_1 [Eumeta japonica]
MEEKEMEGRSETSILSLSRSKQTAPSDNRTGNNIVKGSAPTQLGYVFISLSDVTHIGPRILTDCRIVTERSVQRTKLCRSELAANYILRRYHAPRFFLLLRHVPILRHCDAFVTTFTAAKFHALYSTGRRTKLCRCEIDLAVDPNVVPAFDSKSEIVPDFDTGRTLNSNSGPTLDFNPSPVPNFDAHPDFNLLLFRFT